MDDRAGDQKTPTFVVKVRKATRLKVTGAAMTIGTRSTCDLVLRDPVAAYDHCRLRFDGDNLLIEDTGSATGTFVNGLPVEAPTPLKDNDEIVLGVSRLGVALGTENDQPVVTLQLQAGGFHFVSSGNKTEKRHKYSTDPDRWVRTEVELGRFRPLRIANGLTVLAVLVLIPFLLVERIKAPLLEPGNLCNSHEQLFATQKPAAVTAAQYALAQEHGCQVCHAPLRGTPMSKCARCHGDMMRSQHPFQDAPDAAVSSSKVRSEWADNNCNTCHIEHLGSDPREGGFVPAAEETGTSCARCHGGTELETAGFVASREPVAVQQGPRPYPSFAFGHDDHVNLRHTEDQTLLSCQVCHEAEETAAEGRNRGDDYRPVSFETCARCHVDSRDPSLRGWWPAEKSVWSVTWHGSEDADRTCKQCHGALYQPASKTVNRLAVAAAEYTEFKGRYRLQRRSHAELFEKHAQGKECSHCHVSESALFVDQPVEAAFWHAVHVRELSPAESDKKQELSGQCLDCHGGRPESLGLTKSGRFEWAPEYCGVCHMDRNGQPLLPRPVPQKPPVSEVLEERSDFPHKFHVNWEHETLKDGCFTCHEFSAAPGDAEFAAVPTTREEAARCQNCHDQHANVGGGACQKCHPMETPGQYNVFWGPEAPADRPFPTRPWPEGSPFSHRSAGHAGLDCEQCHARDAIGQATTLAEVPVPDESDGVCRGCHLGSRKRFHWR